MPEHKQKVLQVEGNLSCERGAQTSSLIPSITPRLTSRLQCLPTHTQRPSLGTCMHNHAVVLFVSLHLSFVPLLISHCSAILCHQLDYLITAANDGSIKVLVPSQSSASQELFEGRGGGERIALLDHSLVRSPSSPLEQSLGTIATLTTVQLVTCFMSNTHRSQVIFYVTLSTHSLAM